MLRKGTVKTVWGGALMTAAFFMASEAHASAWCPTPTDNTITCNQCSRELTCDVNFQIMISGNGVTLNGKDHWISYSSRDGVYVNGYANTITYVNVDHPAGDGIYFASSIPNGPTNVITHCYVTGAGFAGFDNNSSAPVSISNSSVYNSWYGIFASSYKNTDLNTVTSNGNQIYGYTTGDYYSRAPYSMVLYGTFANNGAGGALFQYTSGIVVSRGSFYNNTGNGLEFKTASGTIQNNYGRTVSGYDCKESHTSPVSVYHSGNNWGSYSGSGCSP